MWFCAGFLPYTSLVVLLILISSFIYIVLKIDWLNNNGLFGLVSINKGSWSLCPTARSLDVTRLSKILKKSCTKWKPLECGGVVNHQSCGGPRPKRGRKRKREKKGPRRKTRKASWAHDCHWYDQETSNMAADNDPAAGARTYVTQPDN